MLDKLLRLAAVAIVLAVPAEAAAAPSSALYVATGGGLNAVVQYGIGLGGVLGPLTPASVATGGGTPTKMAMAPDGAHLFVGTSGGGSILVYAVNADRSLTGPPATYATGLSAVQGVTISPDGHSLYAVDFQAPGSVAQLTVAADGALTSKAPATVATGDQPFSISLTPDGHHAYVADTGASAVSQFDVATDGRLTAMAAPTAPTGVSPAYIAVRPDGRSAYVTNNGESTVSQYDVGASGALTAKTPATVTSGSSADGIAISPDGASAYVTNIADSAHGISQFDIGAGGALIPKSPASLPAATAFGILVSPDGHSAYVTTLGPSSVREYDVGAGGVLAAKTPASENPGGPPFEPAITPDQGPTASFTESAPAAPGQAVAFDAAASSDVDGAVSRFDWDFGDGTTATDGGAQTTHAYGQAGSYVVTLRVTDDIGCSGEVQTGRAILCADHGATLQDRVAVPEAPVVTDPGSARAPDPGAEPPVLPDRPAARPGRCTVPHLKSATLAGARRRLARAHCRLGRVHRSTAGRKLRVQRQAPKPGARVVRGSRVAVWLR